MSRTITVFIILLGLCENAFGYIDPGSGFQFFAGGSLLAFCAGFFGVALLIVRRFFRRWRKALLWGIVIVLAVAGIIFLAVGRTDMQYSKKIVIIGMDALDYSFTKRLIEEGSLPHFAALAQQGTFSALQTVMPPESNVVWTSFATGKKPGNHGVFDFLMRKPGTYTPYLTLAEISNEPQMISIGPLKLPTGKPLIRQPRKAPAFWQVLSEHKVPVFSYFCPGSFPPEPVHGKLISGMGVPDVRGTMGTFSFYTTAGLEKSSYTGGFVYHVEEIEGVISAHLSGPRDTSKNPPEEISIPFTVTLERQKRRIRLDIGKQHITLAEGAWSGWIQVTFKGGPFRIMRGICRFYLKNIDPEFSLYCTPVSLDPQEPFFDISYPHNLTRRLTGRVGLFSTRGMPYDTWALNETRIDEDEFLAQAQSVLQERKAILKAALREYKGGVFFFYLNYPDVIQHMFWYSRHDETSPHKDIVRGCYEEMDEVLGEVMGMLDADTTLIVISDHGIREFRRAVHLNSWLKENGFLFLKDGAQTSGELFENVDWSRTKAYALGFGGIYLNLKGREPSGIVSEGQEAERLTAEIVAGLREFTDPLKSRPVTNNVYTKEEIFSGSYSALAPDIFVGFKEGYRASWQTALGALGQGTLEDNTKPWKSDHIFDASLVPGVLFVNRKYTLGQPPKIIDIIPTVLNLLGIKTTEKLDGKPLWGRE